MTAQIVTNKGGGPVIGSIVLDASELGTAVALSNNDNTGVLGWEWDMIDAPATSVAFNPLPPQVTTSTDSKTPDVLGHTIIMRLTTYTDVARTIIDDTDQVSIGVKFAPPFDWVIPAAGQTVEADAVRGWATDVNRMLRELHAFLEGQRDSKESVRVATDAALPAYTRTADVITASGNGALPSIDGVSLVVSDRLLLKDGASDIDNGIYVVTDLGSGGTPFVLTRAEDFNADAEVTSGALIPVEVGTVNKSAIFAVSSPNPIVVNTDSITLAVASGGAGFTLDFTNGDLTAGVLTVPHNLGADISSVVVKDNTGLQVAPDAVTFTDALNLDVDLSSFGVLPGTWKVLVTP